MRYILVVLLIVIFGYALALVLQNGTELPVDLLFTQVPAMRLGLLLLLTLGIGIVLGLLIGVQVFRALGKSNVSAKTLNTYAKSKLNLLSWLLLRLLPILGMKKQC